MSGQVDGSSTLEEGHGPGSGVGGDMVILSDQSLKINRNCIELVPDKIP